MRTSVLTVDGFSPEAKALREHFDARFAEPREARADRFVWDYWHVPGQYTALRTPAYHYFPEELYDAFHQRLVWWGRRTLGCHDVSPPWMSLYLEGCRQELHGDLPHGPFAFVFSLTNWKNRAFRGGETMILRDEVLDYWSGFASTRAVEEGELVRTVAPQFNRLTVFDPRLPHGVRRVEGTHDPREGRLVIHGWFMQPRPFIEGPLKERTLQQRLDDLGEVLAPALEAGLPVAGLLSLGFDVMPDGTVAHLTTLCDTTRTPASDDAARRRVVERVRRFVKGLKFPKQSKPSHVTLPLVFER
jgi:hypothetical protein